jgi:hypothetical protein
MDLKQCSSASQGNFGSGDQCRGHFAPRHSNFDLIVQSHYAWHTLATTDAQLPFVERVDTSADRNNPVPNFGFDPPQPREMFRHKVAYAPFHFPICLR